VGFLYGENSALDGAHSTEGSYQELNCHISGFHS
jgi:hypothetical protein